MSDWWGEYARGREDLRLTQLEEIGTIFTCCVPFAASGGQRVMELQAITLLETEQNKVRCLHHDKGVGTYLIGDLAKQEGAVVMPAVCWGLDDSFAEGLLRYVIVGKAIEYNLVLRKTGDTEAAYERTRFLTHLESRPLRDRANRMLEAGDLGKSGVMRQVRDFLSRRIGANLDKEREVGHFEGVAAEQGHHSVLTAVNWYGQV
jgi:hypothetical protein